MREGFDRLGPGDRLNAQSRRSISRRGPWTAILRTSASAPSTRRTRWGRSRTVARSRVCLRARSPNNGPSTSSTAFCDARRRRLACRCRALSRSDARERRRDSERRDRPRAIEELDRLKGSERPERCARRQRGKDPGDRDGRPCGARSIRAWGQSRQGRLSSRTNGYVLASAR